MHRIVRIIEHLIKRPAFLIKALVFCSNCNPDQHHKLVKPHLYVFQNMDLPKDFSQLFKGLFGFPRFPPNQDWRPASDFNNEPDDDQEDHEDHDDYDSRDQRDFPSRDGFDFHFSVVTDPLEIHRFFEQQMDDMMRSFTQGFGGVGIPGLDGILGLEDHSDHPDHFHSKPHRHHHHDNDEIMDSRSLMLKDDEPKASSGPILPPKHSTGPKIDTDLDDQDVSSVDLSKLFSNKDEIKPNIIKPSGQNPWFGNDKGSGHSGEGRQSSGHSGEGRQSFFKSFGSSQSHQTIGSSQSHQTIRRLDGSVETKSTTRDTNGNVTTTVRKQIGDEEHIQITKKEADGTEFKTDEFVNMEATGLEDFNSRWDGSKFKRPSGDHTHRYNPRNEMISPPADKLYGSLFDKFFGR